jgi:hypothetical protein
MDYCQRRQSRHFKAYLCRHVQHIWLGLNFQDQGAHGDTARVLKILSEWARPARNLKAVTLNVVSESEALLDLLLLYACGGRPLTLDGQSSPNACEELFDEYLTVLRESWGKYDGPGVERNWKYVVIIGRYSSCAVRRGRW